MLKQMRGESVQAHNFQRKQYSSPKRSRGKDDDVQVPDWKDQLDKNKRIHLTMASISNEKQTNQ